ncbi:uncharacterized protein LOC100373496 [Saccoglossus kowalevskii]|uniref:Uncharacterized protein LOC100373496 n=1 Tax=Saccoglossus kowalevskii TaxID=10224 RepID=A0ABM0H0K8_SACKO|nr:PREDICTED: uncharacterized protein LOC100373496 [Saccoglossus kowalevskii]
MADKEMSTDEVTIIKEGWCTKESGQKTLGRYNWKKRWFLLTQQRDVINLSYYENEKKQHLTDKECILKGSIELTNAYITKYLYDGEKKKKFCFSLGPLVEDGTTRTYYISCENEKEKLEWMEVLNSTISGAPPSKTAKRRKTVRYKMKARQPSVTSPNDIGVESNMYLNPQWRKKRWEELVGIATQSNTNWKKVDIKDGIVVARMQFEIDKCAVVKVDGIVDASSDIVYEFLQRSTEPGGNFDFPFRNGTILDELCHYPLESIVQCRCNIPLPHTAARHCCVLKAWLPSEFTATVLGNEAAGLMMISVKHEKAKIPKNDLLCQVDLSGIVLRPASLDIEGNERTHMTFVLQINIQGALHNIMKQAYKSKLLVFGMRSAYQHVSDQIQNFVKILNI